MIWLALILLSLVLAVTLLRLLAHRRALSALHMAILQRQPLLQENLPTRTDTAWRSLCEAANHLIADIARLDRQRVGQLAQLEATLGSLQEAVLVIDAANTVLLANKALGAIFPRADAILHRRLETVVHNAAFLRYVEAVRRDGARPQEEIEFADDTSAAVTWLEVTGTVIPDLHIGQPPCVLFVLHNITRQKRLEAVRKDFVANVSHELRTPLSVIKGYVETIIESGGELPAAQRDKFLLTIQRHTDRLNSIIEDLLTLSRLESGKAGLQREPADLVRLVQGILDDYRSRPAAARHELHFSPGSAPLPLAFDPLKLSLVFHNLLDNALNYTPAGSRIDITLQLKGSEVEVCVRDNGPGIPSADLPHLFERFYRVDKGRGRDTGGTGLGLSIVKHIVQLHGGRVRVESTQGRGTAFFFTLPVSSRPS
ncbi:signal transduction histidine kinase [Opitutaceae bacterium TAV1]|nr:histidine kinase [Opitutaceae bacterium TAV5]EIP99767.1 signal transduction histidine kinase [Opitutaceae bacterium TAV1]